MDGAAFSYHHEWEVGESVIWNTCGDMHRIVPQRCRSGRDMHGTSIMADQRLGHRLGMAQPASRRIEQERIRRRSHSADKW
jgi:hypothetical protein